jgi:sugar phosphate isomerase/epimerase
MRVGVITDIASTPIARAAGADHVEPAIVGNLVHEVARGRWEATPEVPATIPEADRAPSSAILFPGGMRVSDPAVPEEETADYLEQILPVVRRVSRPGAFVVLGSGAARSTPEGVSREAALARLAATVRVADRVARAHELEVILEPLHRGETDLVNSIAEAVEFLDAHDLGHVRVVADLYHVMREDEPLEHVRDLADRVAHAHVAVDHDRRPPHPDAGPIGPFLAALAAVRGVVPGHHSE